MDPKVEKVTPKKPERCPQGQALLEKVLSLARQHAIKSLIRNRATACAIVANTAATLKELSVHTDKCAICTECVREKERLREQRRKPRQ